MTFHTHLHDIHCRCLWYLGSFLSYCLDFQLCVIFFLSHFCLSSLCSCSKKIRLNAQVAFFTPFALAVSGWLIQFWFLAFTVGAQYVGSAFWVRPRRGMHISWHLANVAESSFRAFKFGGCREGGKVGGTSYTVKPALNGPCIKRNLS